MANEIRYFRLNPDHVRENPAFCFHLPRNAAIDGSGVSVMTGEVVVGLNTGIPAVSRAMSRRDIVETKKPSNKE